MFVIGAITAIAVAAAAVSALPFYEGLITSRTVSTQQHSENEFSIVRCSQVCPKSSIIDANGFVAVKPRTSDTPALTQGVWIPAGTAGRYEFVLKPGSKGFVTINSEFCPGVDESHIALSGNNKTSSRDLEVLFNSLNSTNEGIYKLNVEVFAKQNNANTTGALGSLITKNNLLPTTFIPKGNGTGVQIYPSEIAKVSKHAVKVTYVIAADPSAIKATYVIANLFRMCPGELLTIGDEPNEESAEWAKGPFYGCVG